ncbi:MAG: hypothetical protein BAJALOKI2v1_390002 [Promethearchaeota archaeon]|nr:MAG: hypothetical protein BAJALOKI2v1_390002 [Candidatus Lokiarchaeota archaeon]
MKSLKLYTETNYQRWIDIDLPVAGGDNLYRLDNEMVRRGIYKTEPGIIMYGKTYGTKYVGDLSPISQKPDKFIEEKENKIYSVKGLSLLSLVEATLVEITENSLKVDLLKLEILLLLINKEKIFRNLDSVMLRFGESPTIFKACPFIIVLRSYLYNIGKMIITEFRHDFLINKSFQAELNIIPSKGYDKIYQYFAKMKYCKYNNK